MKSLFLIIALSISMALGAVSAPTNLTIGVLQPNGSVAIDWDNDAAAKTWAILFNGNIKYNIGRNDVWAPSTDRLRYVMGNLPANSILVATMKAGASGAPMSSESAAITFTTSAAPFNYAEQMILHDNEVFEELGVGEVIAAGIPVQRFSIQACSPDDDPISWSFTIQGSLDGVNFQNILTDDQGSGICALVNTNTGFFPVSYFRINCTELTLGPATNMVVNVFATP